MYVESIQITSFGSLSGFTLDLSDGINVVLGDNEAGKSTVAEFIRYVLYGFASKSDRERYQSFSSEVSAGSIILSDNGKRYRVERRTAGTKDNCNIYDLDTGSQCFEGKVPGEVFFGVPAGLFVSTAFVGQTGGNRINGKTTSELLDNLLFAADEGVNVKKSLKKLDENKVALLHKNKKGGRIFELEGDLNSLEGVYEKAKEDGENIIALENRIRDYSGKLEYEESKRDELSAQVADYYLSKSRERKARLNSLKDAYEKATEALTEHKNKYVRNGFFPDQSYLESLKECASEVVHCDERISGVEKRLDNLNRELEKDREEREKAQKLIREQKALVTAKRSVAIAAAVITCIGFLASSAVCAFLFVISKALPAAGVGALSAVLFGCMIGSFVLINRHSSAIRELDTRATIQDDGFSARLDVLREELTDRKEEKDKYSQTLNDLCARWNVKYSKAAIEEMISVINERQTLETEQEIARIAYVQMKTDAEENIEAEPDDDGHDILVSPDFDLKGSERTLSMIENMIRLKNRDMKEFEIKLASLTATAEVPSEVLERITTLKNEITELRNRYAAYSLAYEKIESAAEKMRASVSPRLSAGASDRMSSLTEGKYDEIGVNGEFSVSFRPMTEGGRVTRSDDYMSAGTSDIAYVSLRLALSELIANGKNMPPVIFDESFSRLDDERLTNMLRLIEKENTQIVILSSNRREAEIMKKENIKHNLVTI